MSSSDEERVLDEREVAVMAKFDKFLDSNGLSSFSKRMAHQWFTKAMADTTGSCERVVTWVLHQLNGKREMLDPWQRRCPELVPHLTSKPFWYTGREDGEEWAWVRAFEENFEAIRAECLALRKPVEGSTAGFQQYRAPSWSSSDTPAADGTVGTLGHDRGDWNVYYLNLHNVDYSDNQARCPKTMEALSHLPHYYHHCFFSALAPNTHIPAHTGPTNKKLRLHLPLVVPPGEKARLRVGAQTEVFREGKCLLFDDSFEHEAWNDAETPRIVLIADMWAPDLSPAEIKFLTFLQNGRMRLAKRLGAESGVAAAQNFYGILEKARAEGVDLSKVFGEGDEDEEGKAEGEEGGGEGAAAGGGAL